MHNITLIWTTHKEYGNCNSIELYRLIKSISPEIIFEELSHSNFDKSYIEGSLITLETNAIKEYLQNYSIKHIPVDTYDLPNSYYEQVEYMYKRIFDSNMIKESRDMRSLLDQKERLIAQHGFAFLNSNQNDALFDKLNILKEIILSIMNDENLFGISKLEMEVIEKREDEIIRNVYHYSQEHAFKQALLFIGSGHRKSMIKRIEECERLEKPKLNWRYYNDLEPKGIE